jgi:hypothetical protein
MDELIQEIEDSTKFLAGALARVSPLPEVLVNIIFSYMEAWQILSYTCDLARDPIPDIMPSIEPNNIARTLNIFSLHNRTACKMTRVLCTYQGPDQIRILNSLTHIDMGRIFHISDFRSIKRLKSLRRYPKSQRGEHVLAALIG